MPKWLQIATFALSVYAVAVSPLLRKPVVAAAKVTVHITEKAGRTVKHPIRTARKIVKEIE